MDAWEVHIAKLATAMTAKELEVLISSEEYLRHKCVYYKYDPAKCAKEIKQLAKLNRIYEPKKYLTILRHCKFWFRRT